MADKQNQNQQPEPVEEGSIFEDPYADDSEDGDVVYENMIGDIQQEFVIDSSAAPLSDDDDDDDGGEYDDHGATSHDEEGEEEEEGEDDGVELPPLETAALRCEISLHSDAVYAVSFHQSDASILVTGGGDDTAYVCQLPAAAPAATSSSAAAPAATSEPQSQAQPLQSHKKLEGHTDSVIAAEFSYDGKYVATASLDATLSIWDPTTGTRVHVFDGPGESIECFAWHQRGPVLFAGAGDGTGWLWNAQSKQTLNVFTGHAGAITDALFTPDGKRIVTVSDDTTLRVWDPKTAATLHVVQGYGFHQEGITNVSVHPDGHMCASGGTESSAFLSNINTGKVVGELRGHKDAIEATAFVQGFPWCLTASLDGQLAVFDLNTLQPRLWMQNRGNHGITRMALHGSLVFTADVSGAVRCWDVRVGGTHKREWQAHHEPILSLALSPDHYAFATSSDDHTVRVFSAAL